ncbi:MAG TPA: hydrogenase maturation protease [Cyclobacteriaceae bacterium]|nr:hydrogenase maturation protease [Cyclobacteriaceae bacterium]
MSAGKKNMLILGIGNDILMDDGIGPALVMELGKKVHDQGIEFQTILEGGMELPEIIRDYEQVIIIDAIKTGKGTPGSVLHFTPANFVETSHLSNVHDTSFLTSLKLGEQLGMKIPLQIDIIAVEIMEDRTFGTEFSPEIRNRFSEIFEQVLDIIKKLV